jgi:hypothetical protein
VAPGLRLSPTTTSTAASTPTRAQPGARFTIRSDKYLIERGGCVGCRWPLSRKVDVATFNEVNAYGADVVLLAPAAVERRVGSRQTSNMPAHESGHIR